MMRYLLFLTILYHFSHEILTEKEEFSITSTTSASINVPQGVQQFYQPPNVKFPYVPKAYTYYNGGFYPPKYMQNPNQPTSTPSLLSSMIPATQVLPTLTVILQVVSALQFTLKALAKFGLFFIGGSALLIVGGIFMMAVCSLTPLCVLSFPGITGLDRESPMTPNNISTVASIVQDAINKYRRLQRGV